MKTPFIRHEGRVVPSGWMLAMLAAVAISPRPAPAQVDLSRIQFLGDIRIRSEFDARSAGLSSDHATLLRTRFGARVHVDSQVQLFIQVSDSRAFGEEENTLTDASADRLDVHQAYLDWLPNDRLRIRAGRQELAFADERLIGPVGWVNVNRSFDGIRATLTAGEWEIDAFGAVLDEGAALLPTGLDPRGNNDNAPDRSLIGVWAANSTFDVFAIADRNVTEGGIRDIDRFTLGGYARETFGRFSARGTLAYQLGRQMSEFEVRQDIAAYLISGTIGYQFPGDPRATVRVQADVLSGDGTPQDRRFTGFNTLYATNHPFYGFMDFFLNLPRQTGFLGLVDIYASASVQPAPWLLRADLHHLRLEDPAPGGEQAVGMELDLTAVRPISPGFTVQAGYSLFNPSSAAEVAPVSLGDELLHWAYLQGLVRF